MHEFGDGWAGECRVRIPDAQHKPRRGGVHPSQICSSILMHNILLITEVPFSLVSDIGLRGETEYTSLNKHVTFSVPFNSSQKFSKTSFGQIRKSPGR